MVSKQRWLESEEKTAQWVNTLTTKPEDLSLKPVEPHCGGKEVILRVIV